MIVKTSIVVKKILEESDQMGTTEVLFFKDKKKQYEQRGLMNR